MNVWKCSSLLPIYQRIHLFKQPQSLLLPLLLSQRNCCITSLSHFRSKYRKVDTFKFQTTLSRNIHSEIMPLLQYGVIVTDTLEDLADHFDLLADEGCFGDDYDCSLADGVMTINLGKHGTYVINKQTPNRQIWLSSPVSGPKRYDFVENAWVYNHEQERTLHDLLANELSKVLNKDVDFSQLNHAKRVT